MADMKHGLTSARPKLSICPADPKNYLTRALEYGAEKYIRGNYHGDAPEDVKPHERLLGYLDALERHISPITKAINRGIGLGHSDEEIHRAILECVDDKASSNFQASGLNHIAHALACLNLFIVCAVNDGILPEDPGRPWNPKGNEALPQKDRPDAEPVFHACTMRYIAEHFLGRPCRRSRFSFYDENGNAHVFEQEDIIPPGKWCFAYARDRHLFTSMPPWRP